MDRFPSTALPAIRGDREHTLTSAGCDSNLAVDLWSCEDGASRLLEACRARPDTTTRGRALRQGVRHTGRNSGVRDEYAIAPTIDNVILQRVYGILEMPGADCPSGMGLRAGVGDGRCADAHRARVWSIDARFLYQPRRGRPRAESPNVAERATRAYRTEACARSPKRSPAGATAAAYRGRRIGRLANAAAPVRIWAACAESYTARRSGASHSMSATCGYRDRA